MGYAVPFGRNTLAFDVPHGFEARELISASLPPVADAAAAVAAALARPIAGPRLRELARRGDRVAIVVTDATRACPNSLLVPALLDELSAAGIPDRDVTVIVGIGLHRASTAAEKREMLGAAVVGRVRVVDPDPLDPDQIVDLGVTAGGVPATINRLAAEANLLIATGIVEPHQFAGYSGGRKTAAIGCGGERSIEHTHGPSMLDHPRVRLGVVEGNPFHEAVSEIARRAGLRFILNVVLDDLERIVAVRSGEPEATFLSLVEVARRLYTVPLDGPVDVAVGGVGHPKDANLYQASRAASYLYFAPEPVVRAGGAIIVPAPAPEGVGGGVGERRFLEIMRGADSPAAILAEARRSGYKPGGQRAFVMAKVLCHCDVFVVGAADPALVRDLKMIPAATMDEAFDLAAERVGGRGSVLMVPHALHTLPVIGSRVAAV